jgi:hypothetical protein
LIGLEKTSVSVKKKAHLSNKNLSKVRFDKLLAQSEVALDIVQLDFKMRNAIAGAFAENFFKPFFHKTLYTALRYTFLHQIQARSS